MSPLHARLAALSSAEDFLRHFGVSYDERVVHVNRLHILKRFQQYLRLEPGLLEGEEAAAVARCRELLQRAHDDFAASSAAREKVFKVFQDADGRSRVPLERLSGTLPSRAVPSR